MTDELNTDQSDDLKFSTDGFIYRLSLWMMIRIAHVQATSTLTPRTRGFHALTASLRADARMLYLVDITILTPELASVGTVLSGQETECDVMLSFHPLPSIPQTERGSGEWLYQLFRDKDEQVDFHRRHGLFPGTPVGVELPSRCRYYSLFWMAVSLLPPLSL